MPPRRQVSDPVREFVTSRQTHARSEPLPLLDFVPKATPRFWRPDHLAPVADLIAATRDKPIFACVSAPPRHCKTELFHHAVPWILQDMPGLRVGYATYGQRFSEKRSARMRAIAQRVGVPIDGESSSKANWRTGVDDGGVWATSVGGPITGEGFDLLIIDDPVKGRASAESAVERENLWEWFNEDAYTRIEPGGSCIIFMARWHEDDLVGRLVRDGWPYLNLKAIGDDGAALCPRRFTVESLGKIRDQLGPYGWASLYMGSPMPRGGALFRDTYFYDALPRNGFRIGKGLDLAYSAKTRADKSSAVVMMEAGGVYYVVDVKLAHAKVPDFLKVLAATDSEYPGPWHWYTSTTEQGIADLATATAGVTIQSERASVDKYMRAQGVAAAWNAGRVLLPRKAPWLDAFVSEVCGFTGQGDRHDDQVDALTSAFARAGGVFAMREQKPAVKPDTLAWWENVDRALAVKPVDSASLPDAVREERNAAEEKRLLDADKRVARTRIQKDRPWWADNPLTAGKRSGIPKPPF